MDSGEVTITYDIMLKKFAGDDQTVEPEETLIQRITVNEAGEVLEEHTVVLTKGGDPDGTDNRLA